MNGNSACLWELWHFFISMAYCVEGLSYHTVWCWQQRTTTFTNSLFFLDQYLETAFFFTLIDYALMLLKHLKSLDYILSLCFYTTSFLNRSRMICKSEYNVKVAARRSTIDLLQSSLVWNIFFVKMKVA